MKLKEYVGRMVRLTHHVFLEIARRFKNQGIDLENCFLVAKVIRKTRKLICYGSTVPIYVRLADVILV